MAFIYKYILKNPSNRKKEDLRRHKNNIEETLKKVFLDSLKEVMVDKDYFEFKLYSKASDGKLRKMGRKLVEKDTLLNKIKKVKDKGSGLFIKASSGYYAYLEHFRKYKNGFILDLDMVQKFNLSEYNDNSKNFINANKREILRSMDTYKLSLYIDTQTKGKKIIDKIKEDNWYIIQGKLSNTENESEIFLDFTAYHRSDKKDDSELISGFRITLIKEVDVNEMVELNRFFSKEGIEYRETPTFIQKLDRFKVVIYNVGQGLCSAVCDESKHPYLYFDFGRGYRKDRCTYPGGMYYDSTHNPSIVLSHWDADHYILVNDCREALDCEWIVPGNVKSASATKLFSELSARGNLVVLDSDQDLILGRVFIRSENDDHIHRILGRVFIGTGNGDHVHNDGLSLLLELESIDMNNNTIQKRVLLTGDNRYGFLPNNVLRDIDVLLATHHGGTYDNVCDPLNIPANTKDGLIVYSYGKHDKFLPYNNSYKHPSYRAHYEDAGWNNVWNTPEDGHYILE